MRIRSCNLHSLHPASEGKSGGGIHPCAELLYIAEGQAILEWIGADYDAPSPSLFLLTPNTPHWLVRVKAPIRFWYIELDIGEADSFPVITQAQRWNRLQEKADYGSDGMRGILHALEAITASLEYKLCGKREYDEEIVLLDIKKTIRLVHNVLQADSNESEADDKKTKESVHTLMRHMESNYDRQIDLSALSGKVYLNRSYLVRAFKHETGITPMQYLNKLRLDAAVSYLANSSMGIQQIAEATGFNSIHYFSRLFKRKYGISPQQWRLSQRK